MPAPTPWSHEGPHTLRARIQPIGVLPHVVLARLVLLLCPLIGLSSCGSAATVPAALAQQLQKALDAGDFDAARKLADIDGAPADARFAYFDAVNGCATEDAVQGGSSPRSTIHSGRD